MLADCRVQTLGRKGNRVLKDSCSTILIFEFYLFIKLVTLGDILHLTVFFLNPFNMIFMIRNLFQTISTFKLNNLTEVARYYLCTKAFLQKEQLFFKSETCSSLNTELTSSFLYSFNSLPSIWRASLILA